MTASPLVRRGLERVAGSLVGAALGAGLDACLEFLWATTKASEPLPWLGATLASLGVVAPVALGLGVAVGLCSWLVHPAEPATPARLWRLLEPGEARAEVAAWLLVAPLGVLLWVLASARLALGLFQSSSRSGPAGVGLGLGSALLAVLVFALAVACASWLGERWLGSSPSPRVTFGLGLGVTGAVLTWAVATGPVSGAGGTLAIFGVFRRQELELGVPLLLLILALSAYLSPAVVRRAPLFAGLAATAVLVGACLYSGTSALGQRRVALGLERGAPLSRLLLGPLRRLVDADHDGASPYFGGGDCDDHNAAIGPGAYDVPGNGVDEDCSGGDAQPVVLERTKPAPSQDDARRRLPSDLNVVILSVDSLRWDATRYAGSTRTLVPNIDRLAVDSVVFDRAYSLASYTGKSIPPTFIGKYTSETHRGWAHFNRVDRRDILLQERLQRAGIRTLSVQGYWYFFRKEIGFERGWDLLDSRAAPLLGYVENDKTYSSDKVADRAIEVLSDPAQTKGRFFFWSHFMDPHADYVWHEGFDFGRKSRDLYDGEVAFTDHHLGRVVDFIRKSAFADRTAIIVFSDHGEAFGEHGMIRHGFELWEELVRVPWLIYVPGVAPHHVQARRSLVDLVPTVLGLFGLPPPAGEGDDFVSGQSLVPDLFGPAGSSAAERIVFVDMAAGPHNAERQAFIEGNLKLVASNGRPLSLYDLGGDPGEKRDLLDDAALRARVVERFRAFRRGLREVRVTPAP